MKHGCFGWKKTAYLLGLLLVLGCTGTQATELTHKSQQDVLTFLESYQPEAISGESHLTFADMIEGLADKRVVFVGERHDRYEHHLNQLAVLQALYKRNPDLAIGLEWFQQPFQSVLDDYLTGKISETDMLKQSGYYQRWRYDYRLFRPILEFAKTNKLPVIALNAPKELTGKVSQEGLDSLSEQERRQLPETIHPPAEAYRAYLKAVFDEHLGGQGDFERFVLVQRIWDETMANNIVDYLQANEGERMVVFAGSGHVGAEAMPGDVARSLGEEKIARVFTREASTLKTSHPNPSPQGAGKHEKSPILQSKGDYTLLSETLTLPKTGKLGVWLDELDDGVGVKQLAETSAAGKAGIQEGDRFLELGGKTIGETADLLILLADKSPGDEVVAHVERDNKVLKFTIKLQ